MSQPAPRAKILIVDDTAENLDILMEALGASHAVIAARDGEKALALAQRQPPPDLILLDIMMPGIDGYEVCRRLKAMEATRDIPVIFLTALSNENSEIQGLQQGGADYIHKPISIPLVQARVAVHLELAQARKKLAAQVQSLLEAARLREDVERILRHDLKGPLNPVIGFSEYLQDDDNLTSEQKDCLWMIHQAGLNMLEMINRSLDLYKMEQGCYVFQPSPLELDELLQRVGNDLSSLAQASDVRFDIAKTGLAVAGESMLCYSMLCNLVKNAVEASPDGATVSMGAERQGDQVAIRIHNQGAVPPAIRENFFDKFATSGKRSGTGLGTYSARLMAQTQRGSIAMDSDETQGTTLTVCLPSAEAL
jgi:CheY-like chemotaxis protein